MGLSKIKTASKIAALDFRIGDIDFLDFQSNLKGIAWSQIRMVIANKESVIMGFGTMSILQISATCRLMIQ